MPNEDRLNKTEPATPRRREEAREQGQVAKSRDVNSAVVLLANLLVLAWLGGYAASGLASITRNMLSSASMNPLDIQGVMVLARNLMLPVALIVGPFMVAAVVASIIANVGQIGWIFTWKPIMPSWERVSPSKGFKRMVSKQSFGELVKSLAKISLIAGVAYLGLRSYMDTLITLAYESVGVMGEVIGRLSVDLLWRMTGMLMVLAALDYAFQRWMFEENLKMTPEEVKEEQKQREGDPKVKARVRRMQREIARQRIAQAVPTADVIITNPRHLAVALRYESEEMNAPSVVAKGAGHLAATIRSIARQHGVPVVQNRPLARALYKAVEVGEVIPLDLFQAVAEVLAYIFWLRKRT